MAIAAGGFVASTQSASGPSVASVTDAGGEPAQAFASTVPAGRAGETTSTDTPVTAAPVEPVTAPAVTPPATAAVTGSVRSCGELHRFVDEDGDTWGECVNDVEGAHARAQRIVAFLGYTELTCRTDPEDASTQCEALALDGSLHELLIQMTGELTQDLVRSP